MRGEKGRRRDWGWGRIVKKNIRIGEDDGRGVRRGGSEREADEK